MEGRQRERRSESRPVNVAEYYSIDEVARLFHVHVTRVRELATRYVDPLPILRVPGSRRNGIVHRDDLRAWFLRNGEPLSDGVVVFASGPLEGDG